MRARLQALQLSRAAKMIKTLLSLPPELVNQILSYYNSVHLSLRLWLVGDRSLHRLLGDGVQCVELRSERLEGLCKAPTFLSRLQSLHHLIIDRAGFGCVYNVYDPVQSLRVLQSLPKTLESSSSSSSALNCSSSPKTPRLRLISR